MIDKWLESLSQLMETMPYIAPLLALLAGVITSITPCALSSIPLIIGYVGGGGSTKNSFKYSVAFALGLAVTFTTLGVIAGVAGSFLGNFHGWWYIALGVLMIMMALQTAEIFNFIPANQLMSKSTKKGLLGAVILGVLGGLFSSPCSTPVLIALLTVVGSKGSLGWGVVLMLCYSVGYSTLTVVAGTSVGFVQSLKKSTSYGKLSNIFKYLMALFMALLGVYLVYYGV